MSLVFAITLQVSTVNAFAPLHMLGVRLTDLRSGYFQWWVGIYGECHGYLHASDVASQYSLSAYQLKSHGWENTYDGCYRYDSMTAVYEELHQFKSAQAAQWFYQVQLGDTLCCGSTYRRIPAPSVGVTRTAYIETSEPHTDAGITFQRGPYVVVLDVLPKRNRSSLFALARLVDQRVQRYG